MKIPAYPDRRSPRQLWNALLLKIKGTVRYIVLSQSPSIMECSPTTCKYTGCWHVAVPVNYGMLSYDCQLDRTCKKSLANVAVPVNYGMLSYQSDFAMESIGS